MERHRLSDAASRARLFADYYNRMPDGVVNNRFTASVPARAGTHYDFVTPEYAVLDRIPQTKWEAPRHRRLVRVQSRRARRRSARPPRDRAPDRRRHEQERQPAAQRRPAGERPHPCGRKPRACWPSVRGCGATARRSTARGRGARTGTSAEGLDIQFTTSDDAVYAIALGRPPRAVPHDPRLRRSRASRSSRCWDTTLRSPGGALALISRSPSPRSRSTHPRWHCVSAASRPWPGGAALPPHRPRPPRRRGVEGCRRRRPVRRRGRAHGARVLHRRRGGRHPQPGDGAARGPRATWPRAGPRSWPSRPRSSASTRS